MKNSVWSLGLALFACAIAACGNTQSDNSLSAPTAQTDDAIVGGVTDAADPAVVALYAAVPGASGGALCTAEVISPTVVLTAAHCVHPDEVGEGAKFVVLTALDLTSKDSPGLQLAVESTHFDPAFDPKNILNGHDVGIVILKNPTDIPPLPFNTQPLTNDLVKESVRLVGYGLDHGIPQKGAGIKRTVQVNLNSFDGLFVKTGTLSKHICSGDSGGPVLMTLNGQETIVGVNSFGFIGCIGAGTSTRVDVYADFVQSFLQ